MHGRGEAELVAAVLDHAQLAAQLVEIDGAPAFVAQHVPHDAELDAVLRALENADREELLRVRIGDVRVRCRRSAGCERLDSRFGSRHWWTAF